MDHRTHSKQRQLAMSTPEEILGMREGETPAQHKRRMKREQREREHPDPEDVLDGEASGEEGTGGVTTITVDDLLDDSTREMAEEAAQSQTVYVDVSDASESETSLATSWANAVGADIVDSED